MKYWLNREYEDKENLLVNYRSLKKNDEIEISLQGYSSVSILTLIAISVIVALGFVRYLFSTSNNGIGFYFIAIFILIGICACIFLFSIGIRYLKSKFVYIDQFVIFSSSNFTKDTIQFELFNKMQNKIDFEIFDVETTHVKNQSNFKFLTIVKLYSISQNFISGNQYYLKFMKTEVPFTFNLHKTENESMWNKIIPVRIVIRVVHNLEEH